MQDIEYEYSLDYFQIAHLEGLSIDKITNLGSRYKYINKAHENEYKVPKVSHHIWLTKPSKPSEIREQDLKSLSKILDVLDANASEWQHFLWINCRTCIPKSIELLKNTSIIVREITEVKEQLASHDIILDLIEKTQFGIAADFFRFDLLKNFGGFYSDLNYILNHSPEDYMKNYDFFTHTDRGGTFVDVYMIAAIPNHPILVETVDTILRNFESPPLYIQQAQNSSIHIQDYTGLMTYLPFNFAFFKHHNQVTKDFVFPLEIKGGYPADSKQAHLPTDDFDYPYCLGTCDLMEKSYYHDEICMETILGFDANDGNSWLDSPSLYND